MIDCAAVSGFDATCVGRETLYLKILVPDKRQNILETGHEAAILRA